VCVCDGESTAVHKQEALEAASKLHVVCSRAKHLSQTTLKLSTRCARAQSGNTAGFRARLVVLYALLNSRNRAHTRKALSDLLHQNEENDTTVQESQNQGRGSPAAALAPECAYEPSTIAEKQPRSDYYS